MSTPTQHLAGRAVRWSTVTLALTATALAGCTGDDDSGEVVTSTLPDNTTTTTIERANDGVLRLGVYLPRTGEGAPLGEPMIAAVDDAVALINDAGGVLGRPVEVDVFDEGVGTGPDPLMSNGADAIIGPASSRVALAQLGGMVHTTTGVVTCSPTATAMALDGFPDNGFFFRTVPSDSLQMAAIAVRVRDTGIGSIAVGFLDDPYGRGLADAFADQARSRGLAVQAQVGFRSDQEDLSAEVTELIADAPGVVVVLGDADDGSRLLAALDDAAPTGLRHVFVNDAIRNARQTIQALSAEFRQLITGIAPHARSQFADGPEGFFTAHAVDCANLIALAAIVAESDDPARIKAKMGEVASGGRVCTSFADCAALLEQSLQIDYNGASGRVDLSNSAGDPVRAWFESFGFDAEGAEIDSQTFEVP